MKNKLIESNLLYRAREYALENGRFSLLTYEAQLGVIAVTSAGNDGRRARSPRGNSPLGQRLGSDLGPPVYPSTRRSPRVRWRFVRRGPSLRPPGRG